MPIVFVEIVYRSDAASFAGFCFTSTLHAEVIEVEACTKDEALEKAIEKFKKTDSHGMTSIQRYKFLRWLNE